VLARTPTVELQNGDFITYAKNVREVACAGGTEWRFRFKVRGIQNCRMAGIGKGWTREEAQRACERMSNKTVAWARSEGLL
jgi:hypothetical protein